MELEFLPIAWAGIIAFCIVMYVILDGFTLGVAILMPFLTKHERDIAVSVILPTWDGNQTWLVLGAASLYGAFPLAFGSILPLLYIPLMIMVLSLVLRGVAFEFRLKSKREGKLSWDTVFSGAALIAVLCQGLILGNFIEGFHFIETPYIVSDHSLITPFVCLVAICLVFGCLLLGSTRLILKTTGDLQIKLYRYARIPAIVVAVGIAVVSLWTPMINDLVNQRWFGEDNWLFLLILPYLTGLALLIMFYGLWKRHELLPYWSAIVVFLCGYIGFMISIFPYIVPYQMTIWQAASPDNTLRFLLVGAVIMLPILLLYTAYSYFIFRGKVTDAITY